MSDTKLLNLDRIKQSEIDETIQELVDIREQIQNLYIITEYKDGRLGIKSNPMTDKDKVFLSKFLEAYIMQRFIILDKN